MVTFKNGETVVGTATYTIENTDITVPSVPTKDGYTSAWETYVLNGGDKVVNVSYIAIEYTVTFVYEGVEVGTATYTVENKEITEPDVPTKKHYTGVWEAYELTMGDVTVNAKYTATAYTVTFKDGETVVATATYTVENRNIEEPAAPTKEGYTSAWEAYTLTSGDVVVNVVYNLIEVEKPDEGTSSDITSEDSASTDSTSSSTVSSGGCFGTIGGLSVGMVGLLAAATLLKKKEDNE